MSIINGLISTHASHALGWTLIHSLWQGALVVLGVALLLKLSRPDPRARYRLGLAALLLVAVVSAATFGSLLVNAAASSQAAQESRTIYSPEPHSGSRLNVIQEVPGKDFPAGLLSSCRGAINSHLDWIVGLWLLGVLLLSLRQAGGLFYLRRLRYSRCRVVPDNWQERLAGLGRRMSLKKSVTLLESDQVKSPMTFGFLKPVILLPVGLATGLPLEQVEALLAHELAHILRNDFLVNGLQNGLETIFFFNPGIRWLSSLVRIEREHCSDDLAVSRCSDALPYARALASLQECSALNLAPALAAAGDSSKLLRRIKRLLMPPQQRSACTARSLAAVFLGIIILVLALGAVAAPTAGNGPNDENDKKISELLQKENKFKADQIKKAKMEQERKLVEELQKLEEEKRQMELELMKKAEEKRKRSNETAKQAIAAEELKKELEEQRTVQEDEKLKQEQAEKLKKEEEAKEAQEQLEKVRQQEEKLKQQQIENSEVEDFLIDEEGAISLEEATVKPKLKKGMGPRLTDSIRKNFKGKGIICLALYLVDENGDVTKVKILPRTVPDDYKAAWEYAISHWKYFPAMKDNAKVKVWMTQVIKISSAGK